MKVDLDKQDRVEGNKIILYDRGAFPKQIVIIGPNDKHLLEYRLVKSQNGKLLLNK